MGCCWPPAKKNRIFRAPVISSLSNRSLAVAAGSHATEVFPMAALRVPFFLMAGLMAGAASGGFPGPVHLHPRIHYAPPCVNDPGGNSRDIAGALTHGSMHHVFQLCGAGWHHGSSSDLVHWRSRGVGLDEWPSGFVTAVSDTVLCAGFRHSSANDYESGGGGGGGGGGGLDHSTLALRCARDVESGPGALSPLNWSTPAEAMFPVSFHRMLPLDPFRYVLAAG